MPIAPEGWPFIGVALAVLAGLALLHWWVAAVLWLVLTLWVIAFFRDPRPRRDPDPRLVLAPADGRVVAVIPTDEPAFFGGTALRISIFMNVFNCHVNRYPADGRVAWRDHRPGRFGHAMAEKASLENEQSSVGLETPRGRLVVRQIAGLVARRIVTDHAVGTEVRQLERLGMIRFGSRVDLFLPPETRVVVRPGDRTRVGETVVAEWN